MCYMTKCAKLRGSRIDHASQSITSLMIDIAAMIRSELVCTELYASYSLRLGEATKESVVCGREQRVNGNLALVID